MEHDRPITEGGSGGLLLPMPEFKAAGAGLGPSLIDAKLGFAQRSAPARQRGLNAVACTALCLLACALPFMPGRLLAVPFASLASAALAACALGIDRVFRTGSSEDPSPSSLCASFSLLPAPAAARLAPAGACLASALCSIALPPAAVIVILCLCAAAGTLLACALPKAGCALAAILSPVRLLRGQSCFIAIPAKGRISFLLFASGPLAFPGFASNLISVRFACQGIACGTAL